MYEQFVDPAAADIVRRLQAAGHEAVFAGGCVRDMVMGTEPADWDIATSATVEEVRALFEKTVAVGAQFGVVKVVRDGREFEVAGFRSEGPYEDGRHPSSVRRASAKEDVLRRDFTINGLLYDPARGEVLDWVGGRRDIAGGLIRAIGAADERFAEDRLRLIRAVRFAARLGFAIEEETQEALVARAHEITLVSAERIAEELRKMLEHETAPRAVVMLDEVGLLRHVLPEVAALKGVEQPVQYHSEGDVFEHTIKSLEYLRCRTWELSLATLVHDVGKPKAFRRDPETGKISFIDHNKVGAEMAEEICKRLRLSKRQTELVGWLVLQHMYLSNASEMRIGKLKRIMAHEHFDDLAELFRADSLASNIGPTEYDFLMDLREKFSAEELLPPFLINGNDLIEMGLRPGPAFRVILEKVRDEQLQGTVATREEALDLARRCADSGRAETGA